MTQFLIGRTILVLEDEYLAALDMSETIEQWGGGVAGPVGRLDQALALLEAGGVDGAVLDVALDGETSYPLADVLVERSIPFLFVTGYGSPDLPERFGGKPKLAKPFSDLAAERLFRQVFADG